MLLEDQLREIKSLSDKIDALNEQLKKLNAEYDQQEWKICDSMAKSNIEGMKLDGWNFFPVSKALCKVEDPVAFGTYVREHDLWEVTHMVSSRKLNAYCQDLMSQQQAVPEGVNPSYIQTKLHIRKVA